MNNSTVYDHLCWELVSNLPSEQLKRVFAQEDVEVEPHFLGFIEQYYYLSKMIPKYMSIIDIGCSYAAQSYFFKEHKHYIGVDIKREPTLERFSFENTTIVEVSKEQFETGFFSSIVLPPQKDLFAIVNYVPINTRPIRNQFSNIFCFYPSSNTHLS